MASNAPTGIAATLGRVWAVAQLTFKEAVRRKVFLIVLIFAAALVGSAPFLPVISPESRLRLIQVWSVRAAFLFSLILAVFLAGFSITGDIEQRRIYTLVTKPIHKVTLFLGKYLGFVLMIAAFLGCTGLITVLYLRVVGATSRDFPELRAAPRHEAAELALEGAAEFSEELDAVRVIGGTDGAVVWRFEGLDPASLEEPVRARIKADLGRVGEALELEGVARVRVSAPGSAAVHEADLDLRTNQTLVWTFPRSCVSADGRVDIRVTAPEPGMILIAKRGGHRTPTSPRAMEVFGRSELFEWSFAKGLLLVLFQAMVVLAITLAASTTLSAPISIILGILIFLVGWSWSFLSESVRDAEVELQGFRAGAGEGHEGHGHRGPPLSAPPWMLEFSAQVSKVVLRLVPNYDLFNLADYLTKDLAVMGRDLRGGFLAMLSRVAALLSIGIVAIWRRDFAT